MVKHWPSLLAVKMRLHSTDLAAKSRSLCSFLEKYLALGVRKGERENRGKSMTLAMQVEASKSLPIEAISICPIQT